MSIASCKLCGEQRELRMSHIIPAFIFRWVRETSGNGFLRFGVEPNKRVQDGITLAMLCESCEGRFSKWEDQFARRLFYPYVGDGGLRVRYGPWLLQFGASLVWRVLRLYQDRYGLANFPDDQLPRLVEAERVWREFLLARHRHPGKCEVHLLPVDGISSTSRPGIMPPTMNRYLMRTLDTDVAHGGSVVFVYAKLPRFIFVGFVRLDHPRQWIGTKVHATEGWIEPRKYVLPQTFGEYLNERAKRMQKIHAAISSRQRQKIDEHFRANVDKLVDSDLLLAMQRDVELFGDAAFSRER